MGIRAAELEIQIRITEQFIRADSRLVTLLRSTRTADGAGGYTTTGPVALNPQLMRLIPADDGTAERLTADGVRVLPQYRLLATPDADMQRWDAFELDGIRYEVVFVNQNKQYEIKGEVAYLG